MWKFEISNVVYKIRSLECSKTYVGQTGRMFFVRCDEHKKKVILHKETNYFKRIIAKMFYIKKEGKNSINVMSRLKDYDASYDIILDHLR